MSGCFVCLQRFRNLYPCGFLNLFIFLLFLSITKMTESGFIKADSNNLPNVDAIMIAKFFSESDVFNSSEIRGVKTGSAGRKSFGDSAVGYVQLKRKGHLCVLKGKLCPEHKVRGKLYNVTVTVNEAEEKIVSTMCHDCAASSGGCKHAVAFLMWIHRRSEDPSPTETLCYWKKSKLASVGTSLKFTTVEDFGAPPPKRLASSPVGSFLEAVVKKAKANGSSMQLLKHFSDNKTLNDLSVHKLLLQFLRIGGRTSDEFLKFARQTMNSDDCEAACRNTTEQCNSKLWHELRYGRVTASKIYEVARCKTAAGSLVENIIGGLQVRETDAMKRGKALEKKVIAVLEKDVNVRFKSTGLLLSPKYPLLGASPDAISNDMVVEIKCPFTSKAVNSYVKDGIIANKVKAQIQLQMHIFKKNKGIVCVTDPSFEINEKINIIYVDYDRDFIETMISAAETFWCDNIFPILIKNLE